MRFITQIGALLICMGVAAADLHPIVKVQTGYLFGTKLRAEAIAEILLSIKERRA
jgi:hypothetical protein